MENATMDPVVEAPKHDDAARLADESSNAASSTAATVPGPSGEPEKPKRKGGFPKGAKRGPGGKLVRDGEVTPKSAPATKVYTPDMAQGLSGEVKDGPAPSGASSTGIRVAPDPALVAYLAPKLDLVIKGATMIIARFTKRPDAVARDDERELMAQTFAQEIAARAPQWAEQAGDAAMGAAVLPYGIRLLELFMPGATQQTVPQSPMTAAPAPAVEVKPAPAPVAAVVETSGDDNGYGTIPT